MRLDQKQVDVTLPRNNVMQSERRERKKLCGSGNSEHCTSVLQLSFVTKVNLLQVVEIDSVLQHAWDLRLRNYALLEDDHNQFDLTGPFTVCQCASATTVRRYTCKWNQEELVPVFSTRCKDYVVTLKIRKGCNVVCIMNRCNNSP